MMRKREADTNTQADIHEKDEKYLRECRENARHVAELCGWERVECVKDGCMRSVEDIHGEILRRLERLL